MDGILSLYETVTHSCYRDDILLNFLSTCSDHKAFINKPSGSIHSVVANINSKLNSPSSRYEGLILLKTYLPQCSTEIFGENVISWMQQCLKNKEGGQNKHSVANTSYQVLRMLLQMSELMPDLKRPISGLIVPKIIDNFQQNIPQEASLSALDCLEVLMFNYGPSCGQQKTILEKYVLQHVDTDDINIINKVARCVTFLPLIGGGGSFGANHVTRWKQEQQKICATLNAILDELFDNVREIPNSYSISLPTEELSLPTMTENSPLLRVHNLTTRFINVSKFLQSMLTSAFPVEKKVLPDTILAIVCRGLAVTSQVLGKKVSTDLLMVGAVLPQIHIALLKILDSLIVCCGCNLLPYAPVISRLVLQTVKWTSVVKWPYGIEKPYGHLRVAACNTLTLWLQTSKGGSCVELVTDELVPLLMQDVQSEKEPVTLVVQSNKSMNLTKRQKKHKQQTSEQELNGMTEAGSRFSRKHIPDEKANSKTCKAALHLLQWIFRCAATFIKPTVHRFLQEVTVELLFEIQRTSKPHDWPIPYSEASCRLELYRLLHVLTVEPHPMWPPPTQFALRIITSGRSDPNIEISGFCTTALASVEKLLHPSCGTLQFPVPLQEMIESTRNYKQQYQRELLHSTNIIGMDQQKHIGQGDTEFHHSMNVTEINRQQNVTHKNIDSFKRNELHHTMNVTVVDNQKNVEHHRSINTTEMNHERFGIHKNTESLERMQVDLPSAPLPEKGNDGENSDDDIVIVYEDKLDIASELDEADEDMDSEMYDTDDEALAEMNGEFDETKEVHSDSSIVLFSDEMDNYAQNDSAKENTQKHLAEENTKNNSTQKKITEEHAQNSFTEECTQRNFLRENTQNIFIEENSVDESTQKNLTEENTQKNLTEESTQKNLIDGNIQRNFTVENMQNDFIEESTEKNSRDENTQKNLMEEDSQNIFAEESTQKNSTDENIQKNLTAECTQNILTEEITQKNIVENNTQKNFAEENSQNNFTEESNQKNTTDENIQNNFTSESTQKTLTEEKAQKNIMENNMQKNFTGENSQNNFTGENTQILTEENVQKNVMENNTQNNFTEEKIPEDTEILGALEKQITGEEMLSSFVDSLATEEELKTQSIDTQ